MQPHDNPRRSYGAGSLWERTDKAGRVSWYGKWHANGVQVKRRIGPKRRPGESGGLTKRQAEADLRRMMDDVQPRKPVAEAITIATVGERYLEHLQNLGRKRSTLVALETALHVHLEPYFREKSINSVTYEDVTDLVTTLRGKGLSPKSMHNYVGTLRSLYRFAMHPRRRWATSNPCDGIELEGVPDFQGIRYLDPAAIDQLVAHARPGPLHALDAIMCRTAAMTGLRLGELCALRWRDVDWTAAAIRVRSNYVRGEFGTPKSRRSVRSVPMARPVAGALERYYQHCGEPPDDALVFADPRTGQPPDKTGVLRRHKRALKAAGLPEHRFHDLRHTFGTAMAAKGMAMRTLQEYMGHRDLKTTERYADYAPRSRDAELVEEAFAPAVPGVPVEVPN
jgi:integrase